MAALITENLVINQGEAFEQGFGWDDGDGNPKDLTGYTARMQIREDIDAATFILELTTENGRILLGGATGDIDLYVSATDTAALDFDAAVYDLEIVPPDGKVKRFAEGKVSLHREVTR